MLISSIISLIPQVKFWLLSDRVVKPRVNRNRSLYKKRYAHANQHRRVHEVD